MFFLRVFEDPLPAGQFVPFCKQTADPPTVIALAVIPPVKLIESEKTSRTTCSCSRIR